MSGSNEGASAPFIVSEGEKTAETLTDPASDSPRPQADGVPARQAAAEPAVIVFGYKERRLPQAAWFTEADADLATRAARLMGLRVLRVVDETHRKVAARLRRGRVQCRDSGRENRFYRRGFQPRGRIAVVVRRWRRGGWRAARPIERGRLLEIWIDCITSSIAF